MTNITELQKQFEASEALLKSAKEAIANKETTKELATELHRNFCNKSHEDGFCSWFFENEFNKDKEPWDKRSHQAELKKAVDLIAKFPNVSNSDIVGIMLESKRFIK